MQHFDGSETNPYAPPETEGLASGGDEKLPGKRPASVRWATVVMGGAFLVGGWNYFHSIRDFGVAGLFPRDLGETVGLALVLLAGPAVARLAAGWRKPITFWLDASALALFCLFRCLEFYVHLISRPDLLVMMPRSSVWIVYGCVAVINLAFFWLFYAFTFGRPSRSYFYLGRP
jgi:hypothetical protein